MMLPSFTQKYEDHSTQRVFSFTFYCDCCGYGWTSPPLPYKPSPLERCDPVHPSLRWKQAHREAFERANREGILHFNRCGSCHCWVCDQDYDVETGMCPQCRKGEWDGVL